MGKKRYGLIAGWGNYPVVLAKMIKAAGNEVACLGALNHADPVLAQICDVFEYSGLAKFGQACRFFQKNRVTEATMAGKIYKDYLLDSHFIWQQFPDWYTIRSFFSILYGRRRNFGNDALLLTVVETFARRGITLLPGTDFAPELLAARRFYAGKPLTKAQWADIRYAWPILRELGQLDISQTITVAQKKILAIEGVDGTDETLKRGAAYAAGGGFIVIKAAKPNQDMRFDVPAVGLETFKTMARCGASVLVLEADRSIFIDPMEKIIPLCRQFGITLLAMDENDLKSETPPFLPCYSGGMCNRNGNN